MSAWALRLDTNGTGLRVAVKDLIDMVGLPTTVASRAVAEDAKPADADAPLLAGIRAAEARGEVRIVGKTTLHELAFGTTGINRWAGTPVNPIAPDRVPGGSSSGSAVAVAAGEADIALGSDTGGSVRIPAACCGIAGLKTTWGRVPLAGVWPLAPSLDTVGPMAANVAGLARGMALLEPGFSIGIPGPVRIGRVHLPADPRVDRAVDRALLASEMEVVEVALPHWEEAQAAAYTLLEHEAWRSDRHLVETRPDAIGADVLRRLQAASRITDAQLAAARTELDRWRATLDEVLDDVDLLALPTLWETPPTLDEVSSVPNPRVRGFSVPVNAAGLPALALPVPADELPVPASLQLIGPAGAEATLLETGLVVEAAVAAR
ncbi:MAG TPA: amidase [Acidimicrobiales bacterium]|nr:amidase [Acidimicrobiales bacterium]